MHIQAVIWDLGGVLIRTEDSMPRQRLTERLQVGYEKLLRLVFDSESSRQAQLGVIAIEEHYENIRKVLGLQIGEMVEFLDHFWEGDVIDYALVEDIRKMKRNSFKTGLLSNAFSNIREYLVTESRIADAFDQMVFSAEEGIMKPDARIYQIALQRLEVSPSEAIFIDDSPANVVGAQQIGMRAIQFKSADQVRQDLRKLLDGSA